MAILQIRGICWTDVPAERVMSLSGPLRCHSAADQSGNDVGGSEQSSRPHRFAYPQVADPPSYPHSVVGSCFEVLGRRTVLT